MRLTVIIIAAAFALISIGSARAQDGLLPLRVEGEAVYHVSMCGGGEYAFRLDSGSSLGLDLGASYGIRDAYNSVSLGACYYPFSPRAVGPYAKFTGTYGFDQPSIQGDSGTLFRPSIILGYRAIVFRLFTGSVAAGGAYDLGQNIPEAIPQGLDLAVTITLGLAF
jgi:hypothetical protein